MLSKNVENQKDAIAGTNYKVYKDSTLLVLN